MHADPEPVSATRVDLADSMVLTAIFLRRPIGARALINLFSPARSVSTGRSSGRMSATWHAHHRAVPVSDFGSHVQFTINNASAPNRH